MGSFDYDKFIEMVKSPTHKFSAEELAALLKGLVGGTQLYIDEEGFLTSNPESPSGDQRPPVGFITSATIRQNPAQYSVEVELQARVHGSFGQSVDPKPYNKIEIIEKAERLEKLRQEGESKKYTFLDIGEE